MPAKVTLRMPKSPDTCVKIEDVASVPKTKPKEVKEKADNIDGEKVDDDDSILDVTDQWVGEDNRMLPESDEDVEDTMRLDRVNAARRKTVKLALDGSSLIQLDNLTTKTFPVIGDNRQGFMRKGCVPSRGIYDSMAPVDPAKLQKLKDYLSTQTGMSLYTLISC